MILDAGSGSGFFLDVAQEHGWRTYGSEYDPAIVAQCRDRGIKMWQGQLMEDSFAGNSFDVITSFEVLEHLPEPLKELELFHKFLRPGGLLYLTTPNFGSIGRRLAGKDWSIVNYPEHLNYFTTRTLRSALSKVGLNVLGSYTTGISLSRSMFGTQPGSKAEANVDPDNTDQRIRRSIESSRLLRMTKSAVNALLNLTNKGDSLKIFGEKSPLNDDTAAHP